MPLDNATGGSYTDLDELAKDNTLVVFRVKALLPDRPAKGSTRMNKPVLADMLICTGPRKGEVTRDDDIIGGGITGPLRRAGEGKDVAARLEVITHATGNKYVGAQTCTPEELAEIGVVYDDGRGFDKTSVLSNVGASAPAARTPVDDDEPPF